MRSATNLFLLLFTYPIFAPKNTISLLSPPCFFFRNAHEFIRREPLRVRGPEEFYLRRWTLCCVFRFLWRWQGHEMVPRRVCKMCCQEGRESKMDEYCRASGSYTGWRSNPFFSCVLRGRTPCANSSFQPERLAHPETVVKNKLTLDVLIQHIQKDAFWKRLGVQTF